MRRVRIWWSNLLDLYTSGYSSSQITIWHTVIFFRLTTPRELFWLPTELRCTPLCFFNSHSDLRERERESHCDWRSVSQSVSLSVEPNLRLMTRYLLLFDSYGLVSVGRPLWREDGSVSCICCWPLPVQSFSGQVPWDSRPYFTVSNLRFSFSSPPTTRRVTVKVFDPASTRVFILWFDSVL
jgi:hypothetical protein